MSTNAKRNIIHNEIQRREERCTSTTNAEQHIAEFMDTVTNNGYPQNFVKDKPKRKRNTRNQKQATDFMYFNFPYMNDKVDRKVQKIFKDIDMPVRLYRKSHTMRNALKSKSNPKQCQMKDCKLKNNLCLTTNCVYKITCSHCQQSYIGSTLRPFHQRYKEHLTNTIGSVTKHQQICHSNYTCAILTRENDPVKLRFKEALLINNHHAEINSRNERDELQHLVV